MNTRNKLTYETFLQRVSERAGGGIAEVDRFLHRIGPAVESSLKQEGRASIAGFGSFDLRKIAARPGHNPQTNATTTVPAHTHIHFSPFQALKWSVNWPYRFRGFQLFPQEEEGYSRKHNMQMFAIAILLLMLIAAASWVVWVMNPTDQQAGIPAAVVAPTPSVIAMQPQAEPIAAAPVASKPVHAFPAHAQDVLRGDNFWDLAGTLWRDTAWWPLLYVENRAGLPVAHPDQLPVGIRLQVPALEGGPAAPSASDLKRLTAAYAVVGRDYRRVNNRRAVDYLRIADRGFTP